MGIDVGKASLDVAIEGRRGVVHFANMAGGIDKLIRRLKALAEARVVVDATAGYYEAVLDAYPNYLIAGSPRPGCTTYPQRTAWRATP